MFELKFQSTIGKISQKKNEDGYFVGKHLVAVVDGGSPKSDRKWTANKVTSGWYCKELILQAFKTVDPNWSNNRIIEYINSYVNKAYENNDHYFYEHAEDQLQAGIIFYNDLRQEIVSYGDCPCLINNTYYSHEKFIDTLSTGLRSFYLHLNDLKVIVPKPDDSNAFGRSKIQDILHYQSFFSNLNGRFGFPVINGLKLNLKLKIVHKVKAQDQIVMASDGYIKLYQSFSKTETYLKQTLKKDRLCYQEFMATKGWSNELKSYDDRTYVKLIVK
ncbi:hypothetical protein [[Mycoplasma] testudinis]|uniref:hypothetical protein n=1 Tax=[Mycoplasma] testudinis TaxID=33924 RepID=UPI00047F0DAD|nr:hypothetical protein [[Mycoplasma] testudinis]